MIKKDIPLKTIINNSIEFELSVSKLYRLFSTLYQEDKDFWIELSEEEIDHAAIIRTMYETLSIANLKDLELFNLSNESLLSSLNFIDEIIKSCNKNIPKREFLFNIALKIENLASEFHYQRFFVNAVESKFVDIFKSLSKKETNHYERILEYAKNNKILL